MILGTGVDITEVNRLKKAIEKWGESFLERIFTREELNNAKSRVSIYQHLAGRFAAKEAIFKALGDASLGWKDLEVLNDKDGKPFCKFLNSKGKGVGVVVSISHVKNYAVANAIITKAA
ncbi:MAG: holo-ACP synthase [Candidatus Omnitrophota bacterium]